jgi:hypothetical protein
MYHRRWISAIVVALGGLFLCFYGISQAGSHAGGKGPGDALALPDGWQTLESGQQTWYAFNYRGDKSDILVQLSASPASSAAFAIWSPTDVDRWSRGGGAEPAGRGSSNAYYNGDLVWAGNSALPGTWYVVVEPSASAQTWFNLKVSGSGVTRDAGVSQSSSPAAAQVASSPVASSAAAATPTPVARQATPVPAQQSAADPYGLAYFHPRTPTPTPLAQYPNDAIPLPEGPQTLARGQHVWYAFYYDGDRSQILMRLHAEPAGSATFTVWSWDVLQRWWEGYFYTPTGRGTPNEANGGDLIWTGGNIIRGQWYVVVEQAGASASTYTLEVSGSGIGRWVKPTPVPTPTYSLPLPTPGVYR